MPRVASPPATVKILLSAIGVYSLLPVVPALAAETGTMVEIDQTSEPAGDEGDGDDDDDDDDVSVKAEVDRGKVRGPGSVAAMKRRFGFGATRTLSGLNGLSVRYYVADRLSLGLTGGFATFVHRETGEGGEFDERRTVGLLGAGPDLFFWPVQGGRENQIYADVGVGLRVMNYFGFNHLTGEADEEDDDNTIDRPWEIDVEVPLTTQVFIGPHVAFVPEFGFVLRIIPGNREPDEQGNNDENPGTGIGETLGTTNGPGLGFELGSHAGMFIGLSVFYFFGTS